jgi:hypothetical protein
MRRPFVAVAVAAVILAVVTVAGFGIAACGSSSGTATTTQAAAAGAPGGGQAPDMSALFTKALDPLVEDGTIASDQESAVIDALASATPGGGAGQGGQMPSPGATPPSGQMPSGGATPPSGAQGSMPDPSRMFGAALESLVSDGTITSAQETAITEALSSAMQQGGTGGQQSTTQTGTTSSASTTGSTPTY